MTKQILKKISCLHFALLVGLAAPQAALAASTTFTFDEFSDGATLTNQYQSMGVTATGVTIFIGAFTPWPALSPSNVAAAVTGSMTFNIDPLITGDIATVSAYVSGAVGTGLYAYDATGILVGQSIYQAGQPNNTLLSVTSAGNAITKVDIHDGGSTFAIDNFTIATAVLPPSCSQKSIEIYDKVVALPSSVFKTPASSIPAKRAKLLKDIDYFEYLLSQNATSAVLVDQLQNIRANAAKWLKASPERTNLLNAIDQLIALVQAGQC